MKYKCVKGCIINKTPVQAGTVLEIQEREATMLMQIGRVIPFDEPIAVENRSIGLEISPEIIVKRRGRPRNDSRDSR